MKTQSAPTGGIRLMTIAVKKLNGDLPEAMKLRTKSKSLLERKTKSYEHKV